MEPLFQWDAEGEQILKALPQVMNWFGRANVAVADDDEEYGIEEQKLSAIFQFARRCHFFLYLLLTSKLIPKNERDKIYDRM